MNKDEFKLIAGSLFERPISFLPGVARLVGSVKAGLFLSQLIYWQDKGTAAVGWVYKDWKEWQAETCLTQDEQRGARRELVALGVIEESDVRKLKIDLFKSTLAFRVDFERLHQLLLNGERDAT